MATEISHDSIENNLKKKYSNFSSWSDEKKVSIVDPTRLADDVVIKVTQLLEGVNDFYFNLFELNEYIDRKTLFYVANTIFSNEDLDHLYDKTHFRNFITAITDGYNREVDYHNDLHAADVLQTSYVIISKGDLRGKLSLADVDIFAVLLAALCHDFKHPGYNNIYLINTKAPLAIRYNGNILI